MQSLSHLSEEERDWFWVLYFKASQAALAVKNTPANARAHTPTACSFQSENARSWEPLGEARPGQSSLSAGALRYRAWAQSWSSAACEELTHWKRL